MRPFVLREKRQNNPLISQKYFRRSILLTWILASSSAQKALKSLTGVSVPRDCQYPSTKMCACVHVPLHQNHIYPDFHPPLGSSSSWLSERLSPGLQSSVSPQIRLKLTALTLCIFITVDNVDSRKYKKTCDFFSLINI